MLRLGLSLRTPRAGGPQGPPTLPCSCCAAGAPFGVALEGGGTRRGPRRTCVVCSASRTMPPRARPGGGPERRGTPHATQARVRGRPSGPLDQLRVERRGPTFDQLRVERVSRGTINVRESPGGGFNAHRAPHHWPPHQGGHLRSTKGPSAPGGPPSGGPSGGPRGGGGGGGLFCGQRGVVFHMAGPRAPPPLTTRGGAGGPEGGGARRPPESKTAPPRGAPTGPVGAPPGAPVAGNPHRWRCQRQRPQRTRSWGGAFGPPPLRSRGGVVPS
jgi:hypothetical protein